MRSLLPLALFGLFFAAAASQSTEAPTGFDNRSNGVTNDATHDADQTTFEEVEKLTDGLGPSITRNPAANATRIRFPARPHK
jgi:hypothetical protein